MIRTVKDCNERAAKIHSIGTERRFLIDVLIGISKGQSHAPTLAKAALNWIEIDCEHEISQAKNIYQCDNCGAVTGESIC